MLRRENYALSSWTEADRHYRNMAVPSHSKQLQLKKDSEKIKTFNTFIPVGIRCLADAVAGRM